MSLLLSYAVRNNKGGVGKSTIAFHIASRYAENHPDYNVLVIDPCREANASMMLVEVTLVRTPFWQIVFNLFLERSLDTWDR